MERPKEPSILMTAPYIYPVDGSVIENGAILIHGHRIEAVGRKSIVGQVKADVTVDLPSAVLMPGFVNAHTHLEHTKMADTFSFPRNFIDWLKEVHLKRHEIATTDLENSLRAGLALCPPAGITTVIDHVTAPRSLEILSEAPIRKMAFIERRGLKQSRAEKLENDAFKLMFSTPMDVLMSFGLAPYSIYSVSKEMLKRFKKLAIHSRIPMALHFLESAEEDEFLQSGSGSLRSLLEAIHTDPNDWESPAMPAIDFLLHQEMMDNSLILIHGNYLLAEEAIVMARTRAALVVCPGSNEYFSRKYPPMERLLQYDARLALGTESRLCNEGINMQREMRLLAENRAGIIPPETIIRMATLGGAEVFQLDEVIGSLAYGKEADIIALPIDNGHGPLPERIIRKSGAPLFTMVRGKVIFDRSNLFPSDASVKTT